MSRKPPTLKRSERNAQWIEEHCRVPEGRLLGQPLKIHPFQRKILEAIYDTPTRTAIISMGRKNAKTALSACILLLHLAGPEAVKNSQLYSSAKSREQAAILFDLAAKIVRMSPTLAGFVTPKDSSKHLVCPGLGTIYRALSAEAGTKHGMSPKLIIHDELGQVKGPRSDLYDALETAQGAHDEPLSIIISTQAANDADLLSLLIDDAKTGADPLTKLVLYEAPKKADPFILKTWKLANPALGTILSLDSLEHDAKKAERMPSAEAAFRNLRLNQRVEAYAPFIPQGVWDKCAGEPDYEVLESGRVYMGLDLSGKHDLTALVMQAEDSDRVWHTWANFFAPEKGVHERSKRDRAPYDVWAEEGYITLTPGASVDYEFVAVKLIQLCKDLDVVAIAFDRWRIDLLQKELTRLGVEDLPLVPHGQGFRDMSPALDEVETILSNEKMMHGGNPVLTMCAANAVTTKDAAGNRKLDKTKTTGRIDGLVALAMASGAASAAPEKIDLGTSLYEQGLI